MPSLSHPATMQMYANAMVTMHERWDSTVESQRRGQFENLVRQLADMAGIPAPRVIWGSAGGAFDFAQWSLEVDRRAASIDPRVGTGAQKTPLKDWLYFSTSIYHEMRHCEQNFMILQALLASKFPMPQPMTRAILPGGDLPSRVAAVMGFPILIVRRASIVRAQFSDHDIARTRSWCESMWGRYGRTRNQTYKHLDRGGRHMNKYVELPEEADAWAVERQVSRLIRDLIGHRLGNEALDGLAGLFA
ncbi:MAG: hypothetical protein HY855_22745 [Burkholderiales bacterium]|nr:hypothetical protein [Burkholderiales bacterium]